MPPLTLEGDTLGKKHQHYNKLVEDAIANKHYELSKIDSEDSDIDNLLKIDIASKTRNVDYIIEAMKSKDMLYATRAIKKSTWLITDQQYANIINPEYLHSQLFPNMNTKSVNKLMLHIRLNLKDENRVEAFYEYLKETDESYKWLQYCSIPFIENVIQNERRLPLSLFKRLCRRSIHFLKYYKRVDERSKYNIGMEILFLMKSHAADVLNVYEDEQTYYYLPIIGKKKTEILMKTCPQRILHNLEKYAGCINLTVVAKHLKKEEIVAFLHEQFKHSVHYFSDYDNLKQFVKNMPKEERFEFIMKTFINKTKTPRNEVGSAEEESAIHCTIESYHWYEYAPFDVAFTELKKLIRAENSPSDRCDMLSVLIKCARRNPEHIKTLLKFYYQKHINEPFKFKIQFVNNVLTQTLTHEFDSETWNVLDQLFHSMEVYTESENNVQLCLKSIVLYKVLHDEKVPDIVENKMEFNTFKKNVKKLNQKQEDKLFTYLLKFALTKIQNQNAAKKSNYGEIIEQLKNTLTLLIDWKKEICDYPFILDKIQELSKIRKQQNSWEKDLSNLYNMKKSWRKHMFELSLTLCMSEEVCLNALKHKPQLLMQHDKELEMLRTNDAVSLRRLLAKIRVYWPQLTQHWTDAYLQNLNNPTGQKALMSGLFMLLPQKQIIDMAKKYVPEDIKVNWGETDQAEINIRKNIAKNLHIARPLIPLDTILWYAKGDYLQYAVPSLNAVLHNLSRVESREHLPKLLEAPVSLQKFGLHLAFVKLKSDELKTIFSKIWNTTKNTTIRSVLFTHTIALICKVKNPTVEKELWELLSMFIDNLSPDESKEIYKNLSEVQNIPLSIQGEFFMKSYMFLTSLPEKTNCEKYVMNLLEHASKIMESLDEVFVADRILSPPETKFCSYKSEYIDLFAPYVLCGKTEENQLQKFSKVVVPAMVQAIRSWDSVRDGEYYVKDNFNNFLRSLVWNFRKYVTLNKIIIPSKLFTEIKIKMEELMPLEKSYVLYTSWKLITEYVKLLDENKSLLSAFESCKFSESEIGSSWMPDEIEAIWKDIHFGVSPTLGPIIVKCLKEDTEQYFPTICWLFNDAFDKMFQELSFQHNAFILETLKHMLDDHDFIPIYLVVSVAIPKYVDDDVKSIRSEIRKKITSHPSEEVQMHYYHAFRDIPEDKAFNDESTPQDDPCDDEFISYDKSHDEED